ncbi:hypothetical protein QBC39DRAFT_398271 [Podospora conica]|nr:hypothetical protein QBC39DRAFT_398271 [Schizothecium conicum]
MSTTAGIFSARTGLIAVAGIAALCAMYGAHQRTQEEARAPCATHTTPGAAAVAEGQANDDGEDEEEEVEFGREHHESQEEEADTNAASTLSEGYDSQGEHLKQDNGRQSAMTVLHTSQEWEARFPNLVDLDPSPSPESEKPLPRPRVIIEEVISRRRRNVSIDGVVFALVDLSIPEEEDEPIPPLPTSASILGDELSGYYDEDGFWISQKYSPPPTSCDSLLDFAPAVLDDEFIFEAPSPYNPQSNFPGSPTPKEDDRFPCPLHSDEDEFTGSFIFEDDGVYENSSLNVDFESPSNPCIVIPAGFVAEDDVAQISGELGTPPWRASMEESSSNPSAVSPSDLQNLREECSTPSISYTPPSSNLYVLLPSDSATSAQERHTPLFSYTPRWRDISVIFDRNGTISKREEEDAAGTPNGSILSPSSLQESTSQQAPAKQYTYADQQSVFVQTQALGTHFVLGVVEEDHSCLCSGQQHPLFTLRRRSLASMTAEELVVELNIPLYEEDEDSEGPAGYQRGLAELSAEELVARLNIDLEFDDSDEMEELADEVEDEICADTSNVQHGHDRLKLLECHENVFVSKGTDGPIVTIPSADSVYFLQPNTSASHEIPLADIATFAVEFPSLWAIAEDHDGELSETMLRLAAILEEGPESEKEQETEPAAVLRPRRTSISQTKWGIFSYFTPDGRMAIRRDYEDSLYYGRLSRCRFTLVPRGTEFIYRGSDAPELFVTTPEGGEFSLVDDSYYTYEYES